MTRVTLKQIAEMIASLPEEVQNKPVDYIDISHVDADELKDMKAHLEKSKDVSIEWT